MDVLSCQTPQMNEKQLWVHLLAYNVIRLLMAQAACNAGVDTRELSFKHTVQLWTEWVSRGLSAAKDGGRLFTLIAQCKVGNRPGRIEPRMRKRRPKPYPWLKVPRAQARRQIQKHGHASGDKVSAIRVNAAKPQCPDHAVTQWRSISWRWILPVLLRGNAPASTNRTSLETL